MADSIDLGNLTAEQKVLLQQALQAAGVTTPDPAARADIATLTSRVAALPSDAVLQMQAATRDILRGFTKMVAGSQAYLGEAGREGTFAWRVGDFSAQVAADPDEGLYVKATSVAASQGAWCRIIANALVYFASWWGIGDGHVDTVATMRADVGYPQGTINYSASATWQRMDELLPDGATIMLPAGTMTVAASVLFGINGLKSRHIRGVKGKTIMKAAGEARKLGQGMFKLRGSYSDVAGVTFMDLRTTDRIASATGIEFAGGIYPQRQNNPCVNIGYWDCTFINVSAPAIIYGSDWSRSDPNGMQRTRGVRVHDNVVRGCDYEYQSFYGVQDAWYFNNDVECDLLPNQPYREFYGFRIIGCRNVYVHSNRLVGPAGYPQNDARTVNIKSAIGPLTEADPPVLNRIATFNVHVYDNDIRNWPILADIAGYVDDVFIHNNKGINNPLPARADLRTCVINMQDNVDIGSVFVERNTLIGYDSLYYIGGGKVRDISFIANRLKCAAQVTSAQPSSGLTNVSGGDVGFFKAIDNVIEFPANRAVTFLFNNTPEGFFAQVWGNVGPERSADDNNSTMVGFGGGGAKGKVQTSPNGPLYDATTAPIPSQIPQGTNGFAAKGTWAALTRDPDPTTYP